MSRTLILLTALTPLVVFAQEQQEAPEQDAPAAEGPEVQEPELTTEQQAIRALTQRVETLEAQVQTLSEAVGTSQEARLQFEQQVEETDQARQQEAEAQAAQREEAKRTRLTQMNVAVENLYFARALLESGDDDIAEPLSEAARGMQSAADLAGQWGTPAEEQELQVAQAQLQDVQAMVANENLLEAKIALGLAQVHTQRALVLANAAARIED